MTVAERRIELLERALVEALRAGARVSNLCLGDGRFVIHDHGCGCCAGDIVRTRDVAPEIYDIWMEVYERDAQRAAPDPHP